MPRAFSLQGHRGARGLFPENTLDGFAAAVALGVDTVEFDVAVTADGVAVVTHDPRLNPDLTRAEDGAWLDGPPPPIRALTLAQLRRLDVGRLRPGTAYAARFPDQVPRDGARIPTLAEVFALNGEPRFAAEMKTFPADPDLTVPPEEMAEVVTAAAAAAGVTDRLTVQSFDWRGLRHLRRHHPQVTLAWLTLPLPEHERPSWRGTAVPAPRAVAAEGGPIWAPRGDEPDEGAITEAHALGLRVIPWDVDRAEHMARLIGWNVDGIITDRPDIARTVLAGAR